MAVMNPEYIEKIYAGWLAKVIGVRLGAPIEGWTYEKIQAELGELHGYPREYKQFAADDDTNGPLFFLRALGDSEDGYDICAQDVGNALLNYASYESGFFWWGGYGISTEHTAYLNLRAGVEAPLSGSIAKNGSTVAEQIGGQIFIDTWGLVTPGNPDLAAKYAEKAASVTHGGNGVYGGIFVASCISYAFTETDIRKIIEKGLSYIPADSEYTRAVRSVMAFHDTNPDDWRKGYAYVRDNFGYDRYPGACHIIPNICVMIVSLLYGEGDFARTLDICNMCGWDTDCNVGNVATIMGVRRGLAGIPKVLRRPINDILICSSVIGSLNISDIPQGADYIAKLAAAVAGWELPEPWQSILNRKHAGCHFEYPGSTHGLRIKAMNPGQPAASVSLHSNGPNPSSPDVSVCSSDQSLSSSDVSVCSNDPNPSPADTSLRDGAPGQSGPVLSLRNTDLDAHTGTRALRFTVPKAADTTYILYKKTYYVPADFDDNRYQPSFSPTLYPGQRISGFLKLAPGSRGCTALAYVRNASTGEIVTSEEKVPLSDTEWREVSLAVPFLENGLLDEAGFLLKGAAEPEDMPLDVLLDDFCQEGAADYTIDLAKSAMEVWSFSQKEIRQFTRLKGLTWLAGERLHLSCADFGEVYTGGYDWDDYTATFHIRPECPGSHMVNIRVKGAVRSYAVGFYAPGKFGFYKNQVSRRPLAENEAKADSGSKACPETCRSQIGYIPLAETDFPWTIGADYVIAVTAIGNRFIVTLNNRQMFDITDETHPYLNGGIGLSVRDGGHISCREIRVSSSPAS